MPAAEPWVLTALVLAGLCFGLFFVCGWLEHWAQERRAKRMRAWCEDFARHFPGRCAICSFHYYGFQHGFEADARPPPHRCIEHPKEDR